MKKLLVSILLTIIVGVGAFAKPFVALADKESIEIYYSTNLNNLIEEEFKRWTDKYSKKERQNYTYIAVVDDGDVVYQIWVYTEDLKSFGIAINDVNGQPFGNYGYSALVESDPVLVGLYFIETKVLEIASVNPEHITNVFTDHNKE